MAMRAAERHPVVHNALRRGDLSIQRAGQIASAADQCPEEAERLVRESGEQNHDEFNKNVDKVRFSSRSEEDEVQRHERMRRARQCRLWTDEEGFGRLHAKLAPDAFAVLKANLERIERDVFDKARKEGAHESRQAYLADALVSMAKASGSETGGDGTTKSASTKTLVRIRVDLDALMRGYAEAGETCEIPGVGRVSVAIARAVLGDALLELVITNGIDVSTVVSDSRYVRKALNIALQERDPTCVVPGLQCDRFLRTGSLAEGLLQEGQDRDLQPGAVMWFSPLSENTRRMGIERWSGELVFRRGLRPHPWIPLNPKMTHRIPNIRTHRILRNRRSCSDTGSPRSLRRVRRCGSGRRRAQVD